VRVHFWLVVERRETRDGGKVALSAKVEAAERLGDGERDSVLLGGDKGAQGRDVDLLVLEFFLVIVVFDDGVTSVEHNAASTINAEVVHQ
jgi:hypothetical protein